MLEYLLVGLIVAAATLYVARYAWRMTKGKATGCNCGAGDGTCPKQGTPGPVSGQDA